MFTDSAEIVLETACQISVCLGAAPVEIDYRGYALWCDDDIYVYFTWAEPDADDHVAMRIETREPMGSTADNVRSLVELCTAKSIPVKFTD